MDLITLTLGHSFESLTYKDIEKYFGQERDETNNLEFKSYSQSEPLSKNIYNLYETICAFLNSDGGIIVWGAPRTAKDGDRKYCKGDLYPIGLSIDKDDVVRKISGNISPLPSGIRVKQLTEASNTILIIEVQLSEHRPHQVTKTGTYYMRVDANNIPAPHHFVEALVKRIRYPEISGVLVFKTFVVSNLGKINFVGTAPMQINSRTYRIDIDVIIENLSPLQNEESPWFLFSCDVGTPIKGTDGWPPKRYELILPSIPNSELQILHFGQKLPLSRAIGFYHEDLFSEGFKVKVLLKFGGRYSPLKFSLYNLDLSFLTDIDLNLNQVYEIEKAHMSYIKSHENKSMADADFNIDDSGQWESIEY